MSRLEREREKKDGVFIFHSMIRSTIESCKKGADCASPLLVWLKGPGPRRRCPGEVELFSPLVYSSFTASSVLVRL